MAEFSVDTFFHHVFISFVALFPPVNPFGSALVVAPFFRGHTKAVRIKAATSIALFCLALCVVFSLIGIFIFKLFGISVPVVQIAGGFVIARMGLGILSKNDDSEDLEKTVTQPEGIHPSSLMTHLFYPLAFPTTMGGGTIAVLIALSANTYASDFSAHAFNLLGTFTACAMMCLLVFVCYYFAPVILGRLNTQALQVCNKLTGFMTFCVGLQIMVNGAAILLNYKLPTVL